MSSRIKQVECKYSTSLAVCYTARSTVAAIALLFAPRLHGPVHGDTAHLHTQAAQSRPAQVQSERSFLRSSSRAIMAALFARVTTVFYHLTDTRYK